MRLFLRKLKQKNVNSQGLIFLIMNKQNLNTLLAKGKTKAVLNHLLKIKSSLDEDLQQQVTLISAQYEVENSITRIVFTPLKEEHALFKQFQKFEKRSPRIGVHAGLRRDCGSTLRPHWRDVSVGHKSTERRSHRYLRAG